MKQAFVALALLLGTVALPLPASAEPLRINGSTTVNSVVAEAAEILRAEKNMKIQVDTQGGSAGGISSARRRSGPARHVLAATSATTTARSTRRWKFPEIHIGEDAVAMIVSKDVWEGGVRALAKQQIMDVFENRLTNWKDLGGPDRRIAFFNKEPGRGDMGGLRANGSTAIPRSCRPSAYPEVGGNEETRNKVGSTRGAPDLLVGVVGGRQEGLRARYQERQWARSFIRLPRTSPLASTR